MNNKLLTSSLIALAISATSTTFAADVGSGTIEFNGVVNTGACTIAPSSMNKQVNLGSVPEASLITAGDQGPVSDFTLELTNCMLNPALELDPALDPKPDDFSKVSVKFIGQMTPTGDLWANFGTANNVAITFESGLGVALKTGDSVEQTLNEGTNVINLSARMQSLGGATAGSVKSTVAYVLDYQ